MKLRSLHRVALPLISGLLCHCGDGGRSEPPAPSGEAPPAPAERMPAGMLDVRAAMPGVSSDGEPPANGEGGPTPVGNVTPALPAPTTPAEPTEAPTPAVPATQPFDGSFI